jgi:hypothetical protein
LQRSICRERLGMALCFKLASTRTDKPERAPERLTAEGKPERSSVRQPAERSQFSGFSEPGGRF